jgi:LPS-assembly protein
MSVRRWYVFAGLLLAAQIASAQPPQPQEPFQPPPGLPSPSPPGTPSPPPGPSTPAPAPGQGSGQTQASDSALVINQKHYIRQGNVEIHDPQSKTDIYADLVEFFEDENRAVATGNVVLAQGVNRIAAERAEFDTKTKLGTFYNASGIATVQPPKQPPRPGGIAPPPMTGQDTIVYFFGETVEKIGPKKYKITNGGFTTCVQPTPRWDMSASTVILNLDHYTLLKNAVMTVKGVPMLYLPVMYYPTKREDRATGFLLPTYGSSTLRGQSLHNAFFWAINRSQDATIQHDYYSKIGQGLGGEYRYNLGSGDGYFRGFTLNQHAAEYARSDGSVGTLAADHYFDLVGGANQILPGNLRARASVSFPSNIQTSQTFNTNIYDLSRNQRMYGGNIVGSWGSYSLNTTIDHREYFYNSTDSVLSGSWPRVAFSRNERPLLGSPLYFSVSSEYSQMLRDSKSVQGGVVVEDNQSLNRIDVAPQIRYPFKKWQWFTINSTATFRETYYTRSLADTGDPDIRPFKITDEPFNRRFVAVQAQVLGPLFNRIWDTPGNGYAEKFKHSIEPFLTIMKTTDIDNVERVVQVDGIDSYTGGTMYTYGLNNRIYAKRKIAANAPAQAREIVGVELSQTYYTNQQASLFDRQYQTTTLGQNKPNNFSPIALSVRAVPANGITGTVRAEFDSRYHSLRTISAQGTYSPNPQVQTNFGWSKRGFIPELFGFNDKNFLDQSINGSTTVRTRNNQYGTTYSFNYDILRSTLLQQRITGYYNAQCCGIAFEYQTYKSPFGNLPSDNRFFMSFTLAGLGNFSPFNGALSGVPR